MHFCVILFFVLTSKVYEHIFADSSNGIVSKIAMLAQNSNAGLMKRQHVQTNSGIGSKIAMRPSVFWLWENVALGPIMRKY